MIQGIATSFRVLIISAVLSSLTYADQLPQLGDSSSGIVSLDEEHRLGSAWVRTLRAQVPMLNDPLTYSFTQELLQRLSVFSNLQDRRLTLVVINNSSLNAFAVPGGIIGVNSGLFLYSATESEFASVLAHELSHLSQRHYAQRLAEEQKSLPLQLATTLAGIVLMATTDSQVGMATIMGGQAAAAERSLAFSRSNEQEADRVGMQVLVKTGYDPAAMPRMFSQLQRSTDSLGTKPPEFLLTHPVTESRIADALNRSSQLSNNGKVDSLDYQFIRTRIQVLALADNSAAYQKYNDAADADPSLENRYGLAFSALRDRRYPLAQQQLDLLLKQEPHRLGVRLLQSELWLAAGEPEQASQQLENLLELYPNSHPISMLLAKAFHQQGAHQQVVDLLQRHSRVYPNDTQLWYQLAEANGLIQDIKAVHLARAEYFLLIGADVKAKEHLERALKQPNLSSHERLRIEQRLKDTEEIRKSMRL
ncbi:MAG: putative Zn-dependent protease [Motiliproteus sp.]|jgi:predicted Zn-dependent protease